MHYERLPDGTLIPVDPTQPGGVTTTGGTDADVTLSAGGGQGGGVDLATVRSQAVALALVLGS